MPKTHFFPSPFGEVSVEASSLPTRIRAPEPLAADWALGWWHAHTAGDEAVFARSFWSSQLAAAPRPTPAQAEVDAFTSRWRFTAALDQETARLSAGDRARVQAYAQGFNQGRHRRSHEAPWTPEDSHLLARTLGFLEWWEVRAPQVAFLREVWKEGLDWGRIADLWPQVGGEPEVHPGEVPWEAPLSPAAWALVRPIRRFRPGLAWALPAARTSDRRAILAASFLSDVTDPGLPFLPVRVETPGGTLRGLSRPGHPGFLAGKTANLAWQAVPAVDDTVDLGPAGGLWVGANRTGTLAGLLALEGCPDVREAEGLTRDTGSACLDLSAVDSRGGAGRWAAGPRWLRALPREAWLPRESETAPPAGPRNQPTEPQDPPGIPGRPNADAAGAALVQTRSPLPEALLPVLRFLLPDSEAGQRLRRWNGSPEKGPEAEAFEALAGAVIAAFWEGSPRVPEPGSPVFHGLLPTVIRLLQAPHSAWMPSSEKNRRLAEAVRRAFAPGRPPGPPLLASTAPKACWTETPGDRPRIWAVTVAFTASAGDDDWRVFLTDDETEPPVFRGW